MSRAVVTIMSTSDTAIDASTWDASVRAAPFLESEYLETLRGNPPVRSPGGAWLEWASHQAYTTVEVTLADETGKPPNTPQRAFHAWEVAVTVHGRDGWIDQPPAEAVFVTLSRSDPGAPWKVADVTSR
ncbi:hypothetical protein OG216_46190 (plasmid) [Streptomycetaceae bacterium NBC_01309]